VLGIYTTKGLEVHRNKYRRIGWMDECRKRNIERKEGEWIKKGSKKKERQKENKLLK